jgi:gluconate 2-dehydrogenase gamma chain
MDPQASNVPPSRREALKVMSVAIGGAVAGVGGSMLAGRIDRAPPGGWHFFTVAEARLVEALSEQIIPADQDPGGKDAGVVYFIDRQLVGPYQRYQEKYRTGLANVEKTSRRMFDKDFLALAWNDQTKLLVAMDSGRAPKECWPGVAAAEFFHLVRDHSMQGFYGSPRHGGNRGYASYKMLGLEYPVVMGQNRYPKAKG